MQSEKRTLFLFYILLASQDPVKCIILVFNEIRLRSICCEVCFATLSCWSKSFLTARITVCVQCYIHSLSSCAPSNVYDTVRYKQTKRVFAFNTSLLSLQSSQSDEKNLSNMFLNPVYIFIAIIITSVCFLFYLPQTSCWLCNCFKLFHKMTMTFNLFQSSVNKLNNPRVCSGFIVITI